MAKPKHDEVQRQSKEANTTPPGQPMKPKYSDKAQSRPDRKK